MAVAIRDGALLRVPALHLIDGAWTDLGVAGRIPVTDPATDEVLAELPDLRVSDVNPVMESARRGFERWRDVPPRERADALARAHALVIEREEELATLITREMGKTLADSRAEVRYAAAFLREYAERATRIEGRHAFHEQTGARVLTQRDPVGVCVIVTPWNFPLAMGARKLAPALAAGCSVVVKPATQTPLATYALAGILLEAGVLPSAVSVVTTTDSRGVVAAMIDHPHAAKLSFTGSTEVGRGLAAQAGQALLRMSMELGGNAPFLVFEDADLDEAVAGAMIAKFRNGGQACTAANRLLVAEAVAPEFVERLAAAAGALKLGPGLDPDSGLGPQIDDRGADKVRELVADAIDRGATVRCGGNDASDGRWYPATVLTGVPSDARVLHEEIFGPVAPVVTFRSEAEAVALANDTPYGLAAYAFTADAARTLRLARTIEAGMVGLNTGLVSYAGAPFGGIGDSGFGREGGAEGLDEYLQSRYVTVPDPR